VNEQTRGEDENVVIKSLTNTAICAQVVLTGEQHNIRRPRESDWDANKRRFASRFYGRVVSNSGALYCSYET